MTGPASSMIAAALIATGTRVAPSPTATPDEPDLVVQTLATMDAQTSEGAALPLVETLTLGHLAQAVDVVGGRRAHAVGPGDAGPVAEGSVGAGTGAYRQSTLADQTPSLNDGWEAGVKFKPLAGAEARVALWRQTAANEMRRKLFGASNDVEAVGKTRRQGLDLELSAKLGEQTRVWVFHSWQNSEILKAGAQEPLAQGKEIDHVPRRILSAGVERSVGDAWRVQATVNTQSDYFLERTNATAKFGAYTLVNLAANYRLNANTSLDFQVRNLFDKRYEYVWYDSGNTFHSPGDGRAVFAAINYRH